MKKRLLIVGMLALGLLLAASAGLAQGSPAAAQIEAIPGDGTIVIGDMTFRIADKALFLGKDERTAISLSRFKEGDWVEFSVNSDGEIEEMWFSSE